MSRAGRVLMVQGTASSVGKSLLVAGLCRTLRQDGFRVAPFKAQNMSNNSYLTPAGEEIGRAQAVQAEAAGVEADVRMNPVLLKPEADHRSQAVVMGRPAFTVGGGDFLTRKAELWPVVAAALDGLRAEYDVVVIEGAGSPAEINLRSGDIVNMRVALHAQAPVLLVGDIDRGGVFAHLYGTLALIAPEERALVRGLIVNKFRGTRALLEPGLEMIAEKTGVPVLGVVPFLRDLRIADEDAVALDAPGPTRPGAPSVDVAAIHLPHVSNFDDLDPLIAEPDVRVRWVTSAEELGAPDLIVLPGTKATMSDLAWMRGRGLDRAIVAAAGEERAVVGVCGGYQMLGVSLHDPGHVESSDESAPGLGLLPVATTFELVKATHRVRGDITASAGLFAGCQGLDVAGYEIHMGQTRTEGSGGPLARLHARSGDACDVADGLVAGSGWVVGTYLHGLFDNQELRRRMLANLAARRGGTFIPGAPLDRLAEYDRLAATLRESLDLEAIRSLAGLEAPVWAG